jgi:hypothetical protein
MTIGTRNDLRLSDGLKFKSTDAPVLYYLFEALKTSISTTINENLNEEKKNSFFGVTAHSTEREASSENVNPNVRKLKKGI